MNFKFEEIERYIGKEVVTYLDYGCSDYAEGVITDFSIQKKFNDKQPKVFFKVKINDHFMDFSTITDYSVAQIDCSEFKKRWGFKNTRFAKHLIASVQKRNIPDMSKINREYKYPEDLGSQEYKEAYEAYLKSFGTICFPVYDYAFTKKWTLKIIYKTKLRYIKGRAYVRPLNSNESESYWNEFKLKNLNKKFFLTKEEGEKQVEKLNMEDN